MTPEDNIRQLSKALNNLVKAIARSSGSFSLEGAGAIAAALSEANKAQTDHQSWLLGERR